MERQESSTKEVLELFIRYPIYGADNDDVNNSIQKLIDTLGVNEEICKNYSVISKTIYDLNEQDFINLKIFFGIEGEDYFSHFSGSSSLDSAGKDNLKHFWRHVVLSCYQRQYIESITKDVKKDVDKLGTQVDKLGTQVDKAGNKANKIYSEFVGILGVFTALSFALMGSVQVFGNILKNIDNPTMSNIGYVLIVGGIYLILIYLIIMTLFIGMKKLFDNKNSKYKFNWIFTLCIVIVSIILIRLGILLI